MTDIQYQLKFNKDIGTPWEKLHTYNTTMGMGDCVERVLSECYKGYSTLWEIRWNFAGSSQGHYIPIGKARIDTMTDLGVIFSKKYNRACNLYNGCFDTDLFARATEELDTEQANRLIDAAMVLCGSPYHKVSFGILWGSAQREFLDLFTWIT